MPVGTRTAVHRGRFDLEVPLGHWSWLRVTVDGSPELSRYVRVPPFTGEQDCLVRFSQHARNLHITALEPDFHTPAQGREVQVFRREHALASRHPVLIAREKTDYDGYAMVEDVPSGQLFVCAPEASLDEPAPYMQTVVVPEGGAAIDLVLTVVAPPRRQSVSLDVFADFEATSGLPPKLFLRDLERGACFPVGGVLVKGSQNLQVKVPSGQYRIQVIPLGALEFFPDAPVVDVRPGKDVAARILLRRNERTTRLALHGLTRADYPVSVYPRPVGDVLSEDDRLLFYGPFHWMSEQVEVPSLTNRVRLVVTGKNAWFLSRDDVVIIGAECSVDLQRAAQLHVRWFPDPEQRTETVFVDVEVGRSTEIVPLRPKLIHQGGMIRPCYEGVAVVDTGAARLVCWRTSGKILWEKRADVVEGAQLVAIGEAAGESR